MPSALQADAYRSMRNQHIATNRMLPVGLRSLRERGGQIHRHIAVVDDDHGAVEPTGFDTSTAAPALRKKLAQFANDRLSIE